MLRGNHYDAAFEAWLRAQRCPYVAVDETRRALIGQTSLKSVDFLVYTASQGHWLVDIKGRQHGRGAPGGRSWENWVTRDDVQSLLQWQEVFGGSFRSVLVFAYWHRSAAAVVNEYTVTEVDNGTVTPDEATIAGRFEFRGRSYSFYGVWVDEFAQRMQNRSAKWQTVWLPAASYRELRFPLSTSTFKSQELRENTTF